MPNPPNAQQAIEWNGYELRSYQGIPNHGPIELSWQLRIKHAYAACVSYVDAQIGLLLDELQRTKRLQNTLIILLSDHGWHLGEQSAWSKMTNFEIATRVPLMISAPGISAGRTRTVSELVDVYPTICDFLDLPKPEHLQGESLVAALREPNKQLDSVAFSQYARFRGKYTGRAIRSDRFRYVEWRLTKTAKLQHSELYDHQIDPHETNNIANQSKSKGVVQHLQRLLEANSAPRR